MSADPIDGRVCVSADVVDPEFDEPYCEVQEWRDHPVPHCYVHGGFKRSGASFSFYFPPKERYERRFFHNTYPMALTSDIGPFPIAFEVATGDLGFTIDSGAYYVQTNNGGVFRAAGVDPAIAAYRVNAAAAKFSRVVAGEIYGPHRPFGYLFGGSGGAYQTLGAAENTSGIWDGFVPFVPGCNHAIPSMFTVRMHALRVLRKRNRFPYIVEAMDPGGSGDPYAELNDEEAAALKEVSSMGYPLRGWYGHETLDSGYFANISGMIPAMDPTYVEDFWTKPGYLGTGADDSIRDERYRFDSRIAKVSGPPWRIELADALERDCADAHLVLLGGAHEGASLPIARTAGNAVELIATVDPAAAASLRAADRVRIDNSWALALQTYHRHQVPPTDDYYGWNQFRDADGKPIYPQRAVMIGPTGTANAAGSVLTGRIHGKMLMLAALLDIDAFAWQADWYRSRVREMTGAGFQDSFALWLVDNAHHENPRTPLSRAHAVSYGGALQQALRDLSRWVETGVRPAETRYQISNTQVVVPASAEERMGIQPVATLTANGAERTSVAVGEAVTLSAHIEVPPGAGKVVALEWDFEGRGDFTVMKDLPSTDARMALSVPHAYSRPGTRFAGLRVTSQRQGDGSSRYGRIQNIARTRIDVT